MISKALLPFDWQRRAVRIIKINGLTSAYLDDVSVPCVPRRVSERWGRTCHRNDYGYENRVSRQAVHVVHKMALLDRG
ncbi:hypothetical protein [Clavibacter sp. CT19]|uniref:hypothetical protein n=1 Tax=unclassified Clavibacter TaxID=2626594 RepID=UPI0022EB9CFA|nr:hypothetical protein [Clavibacter sp. CT19]MDA3806023.1 hypothetical protein [Clavibacter sp. CT19]